MIELSDTEAHLDELAHVRRTLHRSPEIGFEVDQSATLIEDKLRAWRIPVRAGIARHGLVGLIEGGRPGPVVALRAEMDALPIQERTQTEYSSVVPGVMHACGHDLHMACALGAARLLKDHQAELRGTIKLIFQPAEEIDQGAQAMIEDGVLEDPAVEAIFGLHNYPGLATGTIAVKPGPLMAAIDSLSIKVQGEAGHGAMPHQGHDALLAAATVVLQLQTVVSRNISPLDEAVLSIGTFQAGTSENIIADEALLTGTVRSLRPELRDQLPIMIRRIVEHACLAMGVQGQVSMKRMLPPLVNDATCAELVIDAGRELLGPGCVHSAKPTLAGEDFSMFLKHVPGCYFWLGATGPDMLSHGWHSPEFEVDEAAIPVGSAILAESAIRYLEAGQRNEKLGRS